MPQTPQNWDSLKALVADALELPGEQREDFLVRSCDGDSSMLGEARELIRAYEQADGVIDRRVDNWLGIGGPDLLSLGGQRIGRYMLQKLIGEGAMSAVYLARQHSPDRDVALKLARFGMPLMDTAERFKRESQALGKLVHPNIARIYEAGVLPDTAGTTRIPFIAMEFINGSPLNEYARTQKLDRIARIRLMIKVAAAVHAAHQQAVIHRDLKPANVLVDGGGEPKVLDFGIARIFGGDEINQTWQTTAGVLLGTPGYMSPEQAAGRVDQIDVRSDVWGLGVLLYELLAERLPIEVRNTSIVEVLRRIETTEPHPIGRVDPSLRGDLETIVMTALARDKQRRYASAQALADDLTRVLQYEPIQARAPSTWYIARKFARRHRLAITIATAFVLLVTAAAIVSSIQFVRARRERDKAQAINDFLQGIISTADPSVGKRDATVLEALVAAEKNIDKSFGNDPLTEAQVRSTLGWTYFNLAQYDRANTQMTKAVSLRTAAGRTADPETIDDQSRLATILRWQYKPAEALEVAKRSYSVAVATLGPEHPSTVALLDPIAGAEYDMGDLAKAQEDYVHAVEMNRKVMGPSNEQTLTAMNNLAVVYLDRGSFAQAEALLRELIDVRTKLLSPGHPALLTTRANLAVALSEQGRFEEAEHVLAQVAIDAEKSLGPDHDSTLSAKSNRAEMLERMGRIDEALVIQKDVMDRTIAASGLANDGSIKHVSNYASTLNHAERWADARDFAQKALDAAVALHGADHMTVAASKGNLASALDGLGDHPQAELLYRQVIAFYEKELGPDHPRTIIQQSNLTMCLIDQSRSADAIAILQPTLERALAKHLGYIEPTLRRNLGRALTLEGQYPPAEEQLLAAYKICESRNERRNMTKTAEALVKLYDAWSKPDEASRWRQAATQPATRP